MILTDSLPQIKRFLRPALLSVACSSLVVALITAFLHHPLRMSASAAASAVRSRSRHRAQITRFLARTHWSLDWSLLTQMADLLLQQESQQVGTWLFIVDQSFFSTQGQKAQNTYSRRQRCKSSGQKQARRSCHCFVFGLLITPSGYRIPCCRSFCTPAFCRQSGRKFRTQTELAADLIEAVSTPEPARVIVLGDTAFDAESIQKACQKRGFDWITPINPERVLAGPPPRAKVLSLSTQFPAETFTPMRLVPGEGPQRVYARAARCRCGPGAKGRTFWVHTEKRVVHNVGAVTLAFSTQEEPPAGGVGKVQKVLMSNGQSTGEEMVRWYGCRWQIELMFKELKSGLGVDQYRVRKFVQVENWVQVGLVTMVYLEWYRARQMKRKKERKKQKKWWSSQRCHGIGRMVIQQAQERDLEWMHERTQTKGGVRRLRQMLRAALPSEYRKTA